VDDVERVAPVVGAALGAAVTSPVVTIANTAPSANNVQISPASPSSTSSLSVFYNYVDPDGDAELGTEIRWFKNGQAQTGLDNQRTISVPLAFNEQSPSSPVTPRRCAAPPRPRPP
jgi:hypothetical protein